MISSKALLVVYLVKGVRDEVGLNLDYKGSSLSSLLFPSAAPSVPTRTLILLLRKIDRVIKISIFCTRVPHMLGKTVDQVFQKPPLFKREC